MFGFRLIYRFRRLYQIGKVIFERRVNINFVRILWVQLVLRSATGEGFVEIFDAAEHLFFVVPLEGFAVCASSGDLGVSKTATQL